jgi:hypothetical protein
MTARSGIGDTPQRQAEVRGVSGRDSYALKCLTPRSPSV